MNKRNAGSKPVGERHSTFRIRQSKSTTALFTLALVSIAPLGLITTTPAFAQSFIAPTEGGRGGPFGGGGAGGSYGQNGGNGAAGTTGGGGGGPGPVATSGGLPGNNSGGFGGAGGANGGTAAAVPVGSLTGAAGGNAAVSTDGTTLAGGGGGAGGYGLVLTTAGPHATTVGQVFTGGAGGAANGSSTGGNGSGGVGGDGGGGGMLLSGGQFTNAQGASIVGGAGGTSPTTHAGGVGYNNAGFGLLTSAPGTTLSATVINSGTITGGAGGAIVAASGADQTTLTYASDGGTGLAFLGGGSVTNTTTGVIIGGVAGAPFTGSPTQTASGTGLRSGIGLFASGGGLVTNDGQISGGAGINGPITTPGSRPGGSAFANIFNSRGSSGGAGLDTSGPAVSIVNNSTGVISGGNGGNGGYGIAASPTTNVASQGGGGGYGLSLSAGSILNFGQIQGGNAGTGANGAAGQQGGGANGAFLVLGGAGVAFGGEFTTSGAASLDNRGIIKGGKGGNAGTSGAGAAGANGDIGGAGVSAQASAGNPITIVNTGTITGGDGGTGSTGTTNGTTGAGGAGISMRGDGTITTRGAISGGLSGDSATRANAITFLVGVHTLTLQTGAAFTGNVVVNTTGPNAGTFANNTLNLDSAHGGTVSLSQFQNFGHLTQTGAGGGAWTLTGTGAFTNSATVSSGGLSITSGAVLSVPNMVVTGNGVLGGTGTVAGTVNVGSGGTLSPGNSIGVFNINGNLVLGAGAIYLVEVSPSSADRTNITGTAQLGGEARLVFGPGSYSANSYTILSAAGGRSGTFNTMTTTGLPATLSASLTYTSTDVLLVTLTSQIGPAVVGMTPNQRAVAAAQNTAFNSGLPNITALYGLSLAQVPAALDQLSGEVHPTTAGVLADESLYARSAILGRLRQASYGGNTQMASLAMGGPQAFSVDGGDVFESALAYGKSPIVTKAPIAARPEYDVTFWAQGFGAKGRFDGDGNATDVRRDLAGFFSGVDTRVGTSGRAGIAAGYTGSRNNLDGRGSSNVETGHVAGYGGWGFGALNLRAGGDFAWHQIDTSRNIVFPGFFDTATASYKGRTGQVFGEAGYGVAFNNVAVEPFAGGAWVHLNTDGFSERALIAGLNGAANSFDAGYSNIGIRAASMIPLANDMMLVPRGSVSWQHAFNDVTPDGRLAFITAPVPFVIAGTPIARDSMLGEAGLDLAFGRSATIGVSYTGQLARSVQDHAAKGKFSWKF